MKQTVSIPATDNVVSKQSTFRMWLNRDNELFSAVVSEPVSNAKVLHITNVITSGMFLIFSPSAGPIATLSCLAWFAVSLCLCKKGWPS